jgi:putative transposase
LEGKRGQLISLTDRQEHAQLVSTAVASGARQDKACEVIGFSTRTLQRWRIGGSIGADKRPTATRPEPGNKLSQSERQAVIDVCNSEEFATLPASPIVPILADRGEYIASESSFYRVLHAESMLHHRGKAKPKNIHKKPISYTAKKAKEVCRWDISYMGQRL